MNIRRRHATLMELMISLGLTAMLVTLLLGSYWQAQKINTQTLQARGWVDARQIVQLQLQRWLSGATLGFNKEASEKPSPYFFYTEPDAAGTALVWTAHSQPALDPGLSGELLLRLYVNQHQQLCLKMWPLPTEKNLLDPKAHQIVLAEGVSNLQLRFYRPPAQAQEVAPAQDATLHMDMKRKGPSGWSTSWSPSDRELPAMVQLQIEFTSGDSLPLSIQIPEGSPIIVYPKTRPVIQ
jgi:type II secretory pathway component PulJ